MQRPKTGDANYRMHRTGSTRASLNKLRGHIHESEKGTSLNPKLVEQMLLTRLCNLRTTVALRLDAFLRCVGYRWRHKRRGSVVAMRTDRIRLVHTGSAPRATRRAASSGARRGRRSGVGPLKFVMLFFCLRLR